MVRRGCYNCEDEGVVGYLGGGERRDDAGGYLYVKSRYDGTTAGLSEEMLERMKKDEEHDG